MKFRPFTDAGLSPDLTLGELEDQLGRLLKGRTSVLPLDVFQELTGLRDFDGWSEVAVTTLLELVGFEDLGDGLFHAIRKARVTKDHPSKRH